ncbi:MAG: flavin reductase family protein [Rhodoluna sp.]|nr:flavin reductase family protein [Rhodoluna sp.]
MSNTPNGHKIIQDSVEALKHTFRNHASGVAVITMLDAEGKPVGLTATSMTSLGATPPLASFNISSGSSTWPSITKEKWVAIHTLGENNQELAVKMAADHTKRFTDDDWKFGPKGLPIFDGVTAVAIGSIREIHAVENNAVVILDIVEGLLGVEQRPLIYFQRNYLIG